jgi:hypothetical protein
MPFDVSRAYDEAQGFDRPEIWTAERDLAMWWALDQGRGATTGCLGKSPAWSFLRSHADEREATSREGVSRYWIRYQSGFGNGFEWL